MQAKHALSKSELQLLFMPTVTQVFDEPIKLLHVDSDVVVVDKPSSIPVHPVGRFKVSKSLMAFN